MSEAQPVPGTTHCILGEGPIWHDGHLYSVDILGHKVLIYDPADQREQVIETDGMVGTVVPDANGKVVAATMDRVERIDAATGERETLCEIEADNPGTRLNDGKCDPRGRLWVGTLDLPEEAPNGSLYRVDADHSVTRVYGGVTVSNGLVWSADRRTMYYIDSPRRCVMAFAYDDDSGALSGERVALDFETLGVRGYPDGMTIDAEGRLWVCRWAGWGITCFDPVAETVVTELDLPVANVTACAFGGDDLGDLYVTTARKGLSDEEKEAQPLAGRTFVLRPGATGVPASVFAG